MRISISKSKNCEFIYVTKDVYSNGRRTTKTFEKLGKIEDLCKDKNMTRDQVISWAKQYAKSLTEKEKEEQCDVIVPFSTNTIINKDEKRKFNCGYLFLQSIYSSLRFDKICRNIKSKYDFEYNIDSIISDLVYSRILSPSSKKSSFDYAHNLLETPKYELHDVYRALHILSNECDYIQSELYKNSHFITQRNTSAIYYDCTNYYFEIEQDDDLRKYGKSKEHRPNPIVGMGLMMDGDGLPLAFDIFPGNQNEQITLKPIETRIIKDFNLPKFIYCSDAGLASKNNKKLNNIGNRAYIITQSIKKLKKEYKDDALSKANFFELGVNNNKRYNLEEIDFNETTNRERIFYKEIPIDSPVQERMIITYSPKYAAYQKNIRDKQVERAKRMINSLGKLKKTRNNPNDPARFINKVEVNDNGEVVDQYYVLDSNKIEEEELYDGFYAVTTNLVDDDILSIVNVSEKRWQIEECFRIMKTDFKSRPVYVRREDCIKAHFLICFIALLIYRILEKKLGNKFTVENIIKTLRDMEVVDTKGNGFIPAYTRTDLTDKLHEIFEFRTDYEIIGPKKMRNIIKTSKTH